MAKGANIVKHTVISRWSALAEIKTHLRRSHKGSPPLYITQKHPNQTLVFMYSSHESQAGKSTGRFHRKRLRRCRLRMNAAKSKPHQKILPIYLQSDNSTKGARHVNCIGYYPFIFCFRLALVSVLLLIPVISATSV